MSDVQSNTESSLNQPELALTNVEPDLAVVRAAKINHAWEALTKHCPTRFGSYILPEDSSKLDAIARYHWNIQIAEALTPCLSAAEIQLRNAINTAMIQATKDEYWFLTLQFRMRAQEQELVVRALRDIGNKQAEEIRDQLVPTDVPSGEYISELSFKFWTGLLSDQYRTLIWEDRLSFRVPNLRQDLKQLGYVRKTFNLIRNLRNRAYHHEPIWRTVDLYETYDSTLQAIGWFNQTALKGVNAIDRFADIYEHGFERVRRNLEIGLNLPVIEIPVAAIVNDDCPNGKI